MGDLDNTLIFYIWGDNGASMEGTITGSFNEMTFLNGVVPRRRPAARADRAVRRHRGDRQRPHRSARGGRLGARHEHPFQWGKQMASHLGGTRDPMAVAWPAPDLPDKAVASQFTHCIDVGPTILEACGLPEPTAVDGIAQQPMDGTSFAYSFEGAEVPEEHTSQYFEMFGGRAMYQDGWWAASKLDRIPWDFSPRRSRGSGPRGDWDPDRDAPWELYDLTRDFSQAHGRRRGAPPTRSPSSRSCGGPRPSATRCCPWGRGERHVRDPAPLPTVTRFEFAGDVQNVARGMIPRVYGRSYAIEAEPRSPGRVPRA